MTFWNHILKLIFFSIIATPVTYELEKEGHVEFDDVRLFNLERKEWQQGKKESSKVKSGKMEAENA